jgi:hypothetical protein
MKHNYKTKKAKKTQEGYVEEGKATRPTRGTESGKPRKRARKAQNPKTPLNQIPPNKLNANSPP